MKYCGYCHPAAITTTTALIARPNSVTVTLAETGVPTVTDGVNVSGSMKTRSSECVGSSTSSVEYPITQPYTVTAARGEVLGTLYSAFPAMLS